MSIYGTFAGVEVMSELRCNADLPIVIRSSFGGCEFCMVGAIFSRAL